MSIDDISIAIRLPEHVRVRLRPVAGGERILEGTQRNDLLGRDVDFSVLRTRGMILKFIPETRIVVLKLSIPRLLRANQHYNFPLHPLRESRYLNAIPIATFLIDALGLPRPRVRPGFSAADPREALPVPLERWPVIRAAYALDVDVGDGGVLETLRAFSTLNRENAGQGTTWRSRNQMTGVQWGTAGASRTMVYSKGAEILQRCPRIRREQGPYGRLGEDKNEDRDARRALAKAAANVVRFEVTLDGAAAVRSLFGMPSPTTPTLRLMARRDVQHFVLGRELARLRLHQLHDIGDAEANMPDVVNLLREVCRAGRAYNEGPRRARQRTRISLARVYMLMAFYMTEGRVSRQQVVEWFGGGESTLKAIAADLRRLGLPPLATTSMEPHRRLRHFMDIVGQQVSAFPGTLPEFEREVDALYADGLAADAPWTEEIDRSEIEGMTLDDDDIEDQVERLAGEM